MRQGPGTQPPDRRAAGQGGATDDADYLANGPETGGYRCRTRSASGEGRQNNARGFEQCTGSRALGEPQSPRAVVGHDGNDRAATRQRQTQFFVDRCPRAPATAFRLGWLRADVGRVGSVIRITEEALRRTSASPPMVRPRRYARWIVPCASSIRRFVDDGALCPIHAKSHNAKADQ